MNLISLNKNQKTLFYSAMVATFAQMFCIFLLIEEKKNFKYNYCISYILFTGLALVSYYKLSISD